ncbi:MAG: hypothetical protein JWP32_1965 [Schumannella sp.]|nr:hypothetical protein [Schumannella sp.]
MRVGIAMRFHTLIVAIASTMSLNSFSLKTATVASQVSSSTPSLNTVIASVSANAARSRSE